MSNIKFDVKNLNLHYGKFHALKDVNMEIPEKQITAFIGPSGCGKSTFLKCLNRMNDLGLSDLHRQPHPLMLRYYSTAYFTSPNTIATIHENSPPFENRILEFDIYQNL